MGCKMRTQQEIITEIKFVKQQLNPLIQEKALVLKRLSAVNKQIKAKKNIIISLSYELETTNNMEGLK